MIIILILFFFLKALAHNKMYTIARIEDECYLGLIALCFLVLTPLPTENPPIFNYFQM